MIEVIRHGDKMNYCTCKACGCYFKYDMCKEDVEIFYLKPKVESWETRFLIDDYWENPDRFREAHGDVKCPECGIENIVIIGG